MIAHNTTYPCMHKSYPLRLPHVIYTIIVYSHYHLQPLLLVL